MSEWVMKDGEYPHIDDVDTANVQTFTAPFPKWAWKMQQGISAYPTFEVVAMPDWIEPIDYRTQEDVDEAKATVESWKTGRVSIPTPIPNLLGCINASDFNRIEGNNDYLVLLLAEHGVDLKISQHGKWKIGDIPMKADEYRLLENLQKILDKFIEIGYYYDKGMPDELRSFRGFNKYENIQKTVFEKLIE